MLPANSPDGGFCCLKWCLTSLITPALSNSSLNHCHDYPQLGKTAIRSNSHYRSYRSAPHRKMKGKDSLNTMTSLTIGTILVQTPSPWDYPSVCPVTVQRWGTTPPTLTELMTEQAQDAFCRRVARTVGTPV